ncbi:hypothetical protein VSS37_03835 [Candidatus Thiothrix sp. Deng01]|uniref:Uncharacterized protein n=1 Tax=Candidatus Thiothrix phosphatis TaxID=3112415 RepID=A0ABU6CUB2_9GAMM|nr:hypothetical protein [Candidatus Thiothrix sp. Deng01]MEB4590102.1 hypothetical protein [Candidatus Thiothrix sp. Deng01]
MKKALSIILAISLSTASAEGCKCATPECAAGLPPSTPHEVSYEEACVVGGSTVCFLAALRVPSSRRTAFIASCQAGKTAACIAMCE